MKLGLSLSGGGVKGVYHLGYLQYLKENDIEFDVISGTSAGSLSGALFMLGFEPFELKEKMKTLRSRSLRTMLKSLGGSGLMKPEVMRSLIEDHILEIDVLDKKFNELNKDLHIVATDLLTGAETIFNKEKSPELDIMTAMLASSSYPMVFSPVEINNIPFSDGGITNHFPADLIRDDVDYLLGIFVTPRSVVEKKKLKNARSVALRALNLQGHVFELKKMELCDDIIYPEKLSGFSSFDITPETIESLFVMGYEDAKNDEKIINKLKKITRYKRFLNK